MTNARDQKQHSGRMAHHAGAAAEQSVARHYADLGYDILQNRWRGTAGEVDLIVQLAEVFVFVEVKKSASFAQAARHLSPRQQQRIFATATEFVAGQPKGLLSEMRFDVALVGAHGEILILENALQSD